MKNYSFGVAIALVLSGTSSALAFNLHDHSRITEQALAEFTNCYPNRINPEEVQDLVANNLDEDLNIIRKDLFDSHYFHPEKPLHLFRADSLQRLRGLESDTEPGQLMSNWDLGHGIHHLQDMAAPPHVVPVNHWLTDGFENHVDASANLNSEWSCRDLAAFAAQPSTLSQILIQTAKKTLAAVRTESLEGLTADPIRPSWRKLQIPLTAFWEESHAEEMGQYGALGNNYGTSEFQASGQSYSIDTAEFVRFKDQQVRLAIRATLLAVLSARGQK